MKTSLVLAEIAAERAARDRKYGEQNHVDHPGTEAWDMFAATLENVGYVYLRRGKATWATLLAAGTGEALMAENRSNLRASLVRVAVIAVEWIESLDRRSSP